MDCSELCPYNITNFNCEVPQLSIEQVQSISIINNLSGTLYSGTMLNHSVLILFSSESICDLIKFYPYTPKVLGAWLCPTNKQYTIVFENNNYSHISKFSLLEYDVIFENILKLNHLFGIKHNNIKFSNILLSENGNVVFLGFEKSKKYDNRPSDLVSLNDIFANKIKLPDWDKYFQNFYMYEGGYPSASDLKEHFHDIFSIELDLIKNGYKNIRKLGEGVFGQVYEVSTPEDEKYAVKLFKYYLGEEDIMIGDGDLSDINYSQMLKYPYIVESVDFIMLEKYVGIVMEVADTTLQDYMKSKKLGYIQKLRFIYQLASALDYLSSLGYVHCDLKPDNILIKDNNLLLADFSLLRIKENISDVSCQTSNYRAPEQYFETDIKTEYSKIFTKEQIERWQTQQIPAEMWSFGILCLDILYNKSFVTWFGNSESKSIDSVEREYPEFLNLLSYDYNFRKSWETILVRYGKLSPSETEILKIISQMFLDLDQDKRVKSYKELLNSYIFDNINIPELSNFSKINNPKDIIIEKEGAYNSRMLNIATKWMFEVAEDFDFAPYVIFNSVDFFLQNAVKYISKREEIQLFAIASMWINASLHLDKTHSVNRYVYISDNTYSRQQIYDKVIEIVKNEKGKFIIDGIYNYLPTVETLYQARDVMIDSEKYSKLGVIGLSLNLLKPRSFDQNTSTNKLLMKVYKNK